MNKTISLIMLVGLPGSGKSYYAKKLKNYNIVSSDTIRKELYGNESEQGDAKEVFDLMYTRTRNYLLEGKNVVYDATNVRLKKRYNFLTKLKSELKNKIKDYTIIYECCVFAMPYDYCVYNNENRERKVPREIIKRMYESFQIPVYEEGWDKIEVLNGFNLKNELAQIYERELEKEILDNFAKHMPHDNPHHKVDITTHMLLSYKFFLKHNELNSLPNEVLLFHDIGKFKTRTEKNGIAHYFNHENVGAYDYMSSYNQKTNLDRLLLVTQIINYHMLPFEWEKSEKLRNKALKFFKKDFIEKLLILHECDINCENEIV